jgi:hypothetical protein
MDFITNFLNNITKYSIISIIGLAKNVSKTTTLNYIIKNLKGYKLGLTSIGRDGEKYDVITQLPKPRIFVEEGTYVATAQQSLENSEVKVEIVKKTGIETPMGEVLISKATTPGLIELAGPSINHQLSIVCKNLKDLGCDIILVDGAFDRRAYATPLISDATILSTGASVSEDIKSVVDLTVHTVELLTLESETNKLIINLARNVLEKNKIGIINKDNSIKELGLLTALNAAKEITESLDDKSQFIVIKGALTGKLLEDLMKLTNKYKNLTFLVEDGTKLFLSKNTFKKFIKKGGFLKVLNPIKIIAITINPTSPEGYKFNKSEFLRLLKQNIKIPIYDLGPCG